jgi:hypothetical protein
LDDLELVTAAASAAFRARPGSPGKPHLSRTCTVGASASGLPLGIPRLGKAVELTAVSQVPG